VGLEASSQEKSLCQAFIHPGAFEAVDGWHATSKDEADDLLRPRISAAGVRGAKRHLGPSEADFAAALAHWRAVVPSSAHRPIACFTRGSTRKNASWS